MFSYKTVEEVAVEWGITLRHIQNLCREGKIEGAEKRAGAWFIPDNTLNPEKKAKADDKPYSFVGTKKKIFDNAIKLFTQKGYENVSISDISDSVNISQSAVYNHFKSKQQILDTIYGFFRYNYVKYRPGTDVLDSMLKTGSLMDIITNAFIYEYPGSTLDLMTDITKILLQRASTDATASEIFQNMLEVGVSFIEDGLNRAVKIGRLAPFDTHTIAALISSIRLYTFLCWLACPQREVHAKVTEDESNMYKYVTTFMTDLKS